MEQGSFARKGLLAAVIGMGLLIVAGTGVLIAVIIHRMAQPHSEITAPPTASFIGKSHLLHQPAGTHIEQVTARNDGMIAVLLQGGGPDRVVLWDTAGDRIVGELDLVEPAP